jgi:hypothetical protein
MPRRPPPTSLRLVQGPLPSRAEPKHTLPSFPRPVVVPNDVSRAGGHGHAYGHNNPTPTPRHAMRTPSSGGSVYSSEASMMGDVNINGASGKVGRPQLQPRRRSTEHGLEGSGLTLPFLPSSSASSASSPITGSGSVSSANTSPLTNSLSQSHSRRQIRHASSSASLSSQCSTSSGGLGDDEGRYERVPEPVRGPWDHSRAVSLSFDVGSVLALPKPVAISP